MGRASWRRRACLGAVAAVASTAAVVLQAHAASAADASIAETWRFSCPLEGATYEFGIDATTTWDSATEEASSHADSVRLSSALVSKLRADGYTGVSVRTLVDIQPGSHYPPGGVTDTNTPLPASENENDFVSHLYGTSSTWSASRFGDTQRWDATSALFEMYGYRAGEPVKLDLPSSTCPAPPGVVNYVLDLGGCTTTLGGSICRTPTPIPTPYCDPAAGVLCPTPTPTPPPTPLSSLTPTPIPSWSPTPDPCAPTPIEPDPACGTPTPTPVITFTPTPTPGTVPTPTPGTVPTPTPVTTPLPGTTPTPQATRTPVPTPASTPIASTTPLPVPSPTLLPPPTPDRRPKSYVMAGTTLLKNAAGPSKIGGSLALAGSVGTPPASVMLDSTVVRFNVLGFLPVYASVGFTQAESGHASVSADAVSVTTSISIKVPSVSLFGFFPIGGGSSCVGGTAPLTIQSTPGSFTLAAGGMATGSYTVAPLTGCGIFNDAISNALAGPGNTLQLALRTTSPTP